ncbi:MAG: hypothetical protein AAF289_00255 [Cyanobacteria bacterium P01_A01_bin.135]
MLSIFANAAQHIEPTTGLLIAAALLTTLMWITVFMLRRTLLQIERQKTEPCRHCRYFTRSRYLQCTVHPSWPCTDAAASCIDYESAYEYPPVRRFKAATGISTAKLR